MLQLGILITHTLLLYKVSIISLRKKTIPKGNLPKKESIFKLRIWEATLS